MRPDSIAAPPPVVRRRHVGRWATAAVVVIVLAYLVRAFVHAKIDYSITAEYLTKPFIIRGALNTLVISVLSMVLGLVLGTLSALAGLSSNPVLRAVSVGYVWLFRGTPVLVQLLLWYNLALIFPTVTVPGLGTYLTNTIMTPFVAALVGLGINEGAYLSEIIRGGIISVDRGQIQAAKALCMEPWAITRKIVLPQAFRVALPSTGNQFVIMLKSSSLASVVQYGELLYASQTVYQRNLAIMELLIVASIWYIVLTTIFTLIQATIERRLGRSHRATNAARRTRNNPGSRS